VEGDPFLGLAAVFSHQEGKFGTLSASAAEKEPNLSSINCSLHSLVVVVPE
jgi:hypothetical protein